MRESLQQFLFANNIGLSPSISSQFTLLQPKIAKKSLKPLFSGFKVNQDYHCRHSKKVVANACYVKQHACAYLQPFSRQTNQQRINNHFLEGYSCLTPACAGLLEPRGSRLRLLKSTFNAKNFVRSLSWSISCHFGAIHS